MPRRNARPLLRALEERNAPAVFTVMNTNDAGAGSLRQAVLDANALAGADSVVFDAAVFASSQTITPISGQYVITDAVEIVGPAARLTVNANKASRIFHVNTSALAQTKITQLKLMNAYATSSGGAILHTSGTLTLAFMGFVNCTASAGAAISLESSDATLTIADSELTGNSNDVIRLLPTGTATIMRCLIADNLGGAIVAHNGTVTVLNSTISGNSGPLAGGIYAGNPVNLTVNNCTIVDNLNSGVFSDSNFGSATVTINSTIVANNLNYDVKALVLGRRNLVRSTVGFSPLEFPNYSNLDPMLSPLGDHGGPTRTYVLLPGSPAINKGLNPSGLTTDQRGPGFLRVAGIAADIGAFESSGEVPVALSKAPVVQTAGLTLQSIHVTYADDMAIDVKSLGTGDITVSGPGGFMAVPSFVGVDINSNGSPRIATYQLTAPGGAWDPAETGTYTVTMVAGQVFDTNVPMPNAVPPGIIGTTSVAIPQTFRVDIVSDEDDNNHSAGDLSLREAIKLANQFSGVPDRITFDPTIFAAPLSIPGFLTITDPVEIIGPAARLTLEGGYILIDVPSFSGQPISITRLTIGESLNSYGIYNYDEALTLNDVTINNCIGSYYGGAIRVSKEPGSVALYNCVLSNNRVATSFQGSSFGGGIYLGPNTSGSVVKCSLTNNVVVPGGLDDSGGAIFASVGAKLTIVDSLIAGNSAPYGGGISLYDATAVIRNCTFTNNKASLGAAILAVGNSSLLIQNSTIAGNTASANGGGIYSSSALVTVESTILDNDTSGLIADVYGTLSANHCLFRNPTGATINGVNNLFNISAMLGALGNNGGPTQTMPLLPGSPCINAGNNVAGLLADQRGFTRVTNGTADIGAYEAGAVAVAPPTAKLSVNNGNVQRSMVTAFEVTFSTVVQFLNGIASAMVLTRTGSAGPIGAVPFAVSQTGNTATLQFADPTFAPLGGSLIDGRYQLTLNADQIYGAGGLLDGNGNGIGGDTQVLDFHRLFGDANGDRYVGPTDFLAFRAALGGSGITFDFTNDGYVGVNDFLQFRLRFGGSI